MSKRNRSSYIDSDSDEKSNNDLEEVQFFFFENYKYNCSINCLFLELTQWYLTTVNLKIMYKRYIIVVLMIY